MNEPANLQAWFRRRGVPLLALASGGELALRFSTPVAEHQATRQAAGLFDFSFMGTWDFQGPAACAALGSLQTRALHALAPGRIAYTLLLDARGAVFIDATVWRLGPEHFRLFTGRPSDARHIQAHLRGCGAQALDRCGRDAVLAVQGPRSAALLARLFGAPLLRTLPYFAFAQARFEGLPLLLGRIGYSGELGYELVLEQAAAVPLWQALLREGAALGLAECGFEAADMLRIECGHILFERELRSAVTPAALGLQRLVNTGPLQRDSNAGTARRLAGLVFEPCGPAAGQPCWQASISSEADSPSLGRRIALAWLDARAQPGEMARAPGGRMARVHALPFLPALRSRPKAPPEL